MIVIDVGCGTKGGGSNSISYLIREHNPHRLIGFDPSAEAAEYTEGRTSVVVYPQVAWTFDGEVAFRTTDEHGFGRVDEELGVMTPCEDLANLILHRIDLRHQVVLKIDAEGAEYFLLPYLIMRHVFKDVKVLWVEWHPEHERFDGQAGRLIDMIVDQGCEVREWTL